MSESLVSPLETTYARVTSLDIARCPTLPLKTLDLRTVDAFLADLPSFRQFSGTFQTIRCSDPPWTAESAQLYLASQLQNAAVVVVAEENHELFERSQAALKAVTDRHLTTR